MELRAGAVGFKLASLPLLLIVSTTVLKVLNVETLLHGFRSKETLNNKTKTQDESSLFFFFSIFVKKWDLGRILFIFISLINSNEILL